MPIGYKARNTVRTVKHRVLRVRLDHWCSRLCKICGHVDMQGECECPPDFDPAEKKCTNFIHKR